MREFEQLINNPDDKVCLFVCNYTKDKWEMENVFDYNEEAARHRAERSAIYNMLESFPHDWRCNPSAVRKWLALWQKQADDLCEGGKYAK